MGDLSDKYKLGQIIWDKYLIYVGDLWPNVNLRLNGIFQAVGAPVVCYQCWHRQAGIDIILSAGAKNLSAEQK